MFTVKKPFDYKGVIDRGNGRESWNGVVRRGWKVQLTTRTGRDYMAQQIVYRTKEDKRAYIVHAGGPWFEVRYGDKSEKVQGKQKAEELRDKWNA